MYRSSSGLARREVLAIVVCVSLLGIFALLPALAKAQAKARRASCQCRLKQMGLAFRTWEGDFSDVYPMSVPVAQGGSKECQAGSNLFRHFTVMSNEINNPLILVCPADTRKPAKDFQHFSNTNLSYFVGLDADETRPAMWLDGDRNLVTNGAPAAPGLVVLTPQDTVTWSQTMHQGAGDIGLADGSVQQTGPESLRSLQISSGTNLIRLAMP
jgi:hypothetical protein